MHLLTTILLTALLAPLPSHGNDLTIKPLKGFEVVEFEMTNFFGEDGYPAYRTTDPRGPLGDVAMSLRCSEGYDGNVVWKYKEIMVFDQNGKVIKRKEPRGNVASERGFRFAFPTLEECEKSAATVLSEGAKCRVKLQLNKKREMAKFISAECKVAPSPSAVDSSLTPATHKKTTSQ